MNKHKEAQEGHVELNVGGYRFQTSVQTLRRVPHTFFDAYFSGRYAQEVCSDGSIFVDRNGEHFGHILQYMRDGVVSVAEAGARPSVSLLRALKCEFGFYCIEPNVELKLEQPYAFVMGGPDILDTGLGSMERYDPLSGQWSAAANMSSARYDFGACVVAGYVYVTGGADSIDVDLSALSIVEKYSPSSDTWSAVAPLPEARVSHAAVAVGSAIYVLGGLAGDGVDGDDDIYTATAGSLRLNCAQDSWSRVAPMPEPITSAAACAVGSDIYIFGGNNMVFQDQASVFKYDTVADTWITLAPMPWACSYHSAIAIDCLVYIVGAGDRNSDLLQFDVASGLWSTLAHHSRRLETGGSFVLGGCLYATGGCDADAIFRRSVERYDVSANTWTPVANMLEARGRFGAVTIGSLGPAEEQDLFDSLIDKAATQRS